MCKICGAFKRDWWHKAGLVVQSVMSATDKLGYWEVQYVTCLTQILL